TLDLPDHGSGGGEHHLVVPGDHIPQSRCSAFVGHVHDIDPGLRFEQLAGEMRGRAVPGRGKIELAWLLLGERDQLLEGMSRHALVYHQNIGLRANQRDRDEVFSRAIIEMFVETLVGGEDAIVTHQQRVAIWDRMRDSLSREIAAGAWAIFDYKRLTEQLLHFFADDTSEDVTRAPGRKCHNQRDWAVRIVGRERRHEK